MSAQTKKQKKKTENMNPKVLKANNGKQSYYQNVLCVVVKNQDIIKLKHH